jgi:predicted permease
VAQADVFDGAAAITPTTANITGQGDPERVPGQLVTPGYFGVLGVRLAQGRAFDDHDVRAESRVVVISDALWRRRFASRADIVNAPLTMDGEQYVVVGVAPPSVSYPANVQFWRPLVFTPRDVSAEARGAQFVQVLARLKPGVNVAAASSALGTVAARFATLYPRTETGSMAQAVGLQDRIVRGIKPTLQRLLLAVSLVLIIACANVAGLLLARAAQRGREIGVRTALGAGRARLVAQLLLESAMLGALGVAGGIVLAWWLVGALVSRAPAGVPRLADARLDATVLAFAVVVGIVTTVAFGLMPALFATGRIAPSRLATGVRARVSGAGQRTRRVLVAAEIALAVVLLAGAALLLRSYAAVRDVNPGFDARDVMTFQLSLPRETYPDSAAIDGFVTRLLTGLRARPGVTAAAAAMGVPFDTSLGASTGFRIPDAPPAPGSQRSAALRIVTPDYFNAVAIPMRRGRVFQDGDTAASPEVAIVNERFAALYFGGRDPIGREILVGVSLSRGARNGPKTIVGIVGNVKSAGLEGEAPAEIYLPYAQAPVPGLTIAVRSAADPRALAPDLRRAVAALDPLLPLSNLKPLADLVDASIAARRFAMLLAVLFAGVSLLLSAVGLYGVLAHLVAARASEVGVRLALGATSANVMWLFLREGLWLTLAGLTAGLAAARATAGVLASSLVGVTASDPATLASVAMTLAAVALLAIALPVRRATRIDPASLLRDV